MPDTTPDIRPDVAPLVVVCFKGSRKSYYHNRGGVDVAVGSWCFVEADRGRDLGRAVYVGPGSERWRGVADKQGVLGLATDADVDRLQEIRREEREFLDVCAQKVQARGLPMDLVGAERQYDGRKITFYFIADGRVDFRQLVRDLATVFRTRIELRQIGVRDEAKLVGGIGICGRELCCSSFMHDFVSVSLKMAKDQQLPLNPVKLSGLCGRLRCCLTYEHGGYRAILDRLPRAGASVTWRGQAARVRKLDPVRELVTIVLAEGEADPVTVPAEELTFAPRVEPDPAAPGAPASAGKRRRRGGRRGGSGPA